MSENLEYQYDQVIKFIDDYRRFVSRISLRAFWMALRSPLKYSKLTDRARKAGKFPYMVFEQANPLSGKNSDMNRVFLADLATEDERANDYFAVATSDYPTEALSNLLNTRFANVNFDKLKTLHDSKKAQLAQFKLTHVPGLILAGAALTLKSIPKKVVETQLHYLYEDFEVKVFHVTLFFLGYVFLVLLPVSWIYFRANRIYRYAGNVLEYTAIKDK